MERTPLNNFSNHEIDIINEITFTMAIARDRYLNTYNMPSTIVNTFSKLTLSKKNLFRIFMTLMISNMNQEKGMYPKEIHEKLTEISTVFFKESKDTFLNRLSTRSKLLKEFENRGISFSIKGKKKIKQESPKSISRKPNVGKAKARHEGYPIVYKLTGTIQKYKEILSNPQCVAIINNRLQKYCKLEKTYDLITKQAFYAFKKGDEKCTIFWKLLKSCLLCWIQMRFQTLG